MNYTQLSQTYRDDVLAEAIYAREVEYFHYDFDRINFSELLKEMPLGDYRTDIEARLVSTIAQMRNVENICNVLLAQVTDAKAHAAAIVRTTEKRENHVSTR